MAGVIFHIIIKLAKTIHYIIGFIIDPPFPSSKYPHDQPPLII